MPISGDLEIYERFCMSHLCRLYAGVMSRGGHVTYVKELCHICEGVMSHMWRSHVTYNIRSQVTCVKQSCHVCYEGVMSHVWRNHAIYVKESCHMCYKGVMSHVWSCHATYVKESFRICYEGVMSRRRSHGTYNMKKSCHICEGSCHICEGVMSHMCRSDATYVNQSCHICEGVMSHMLWRSHVTHVSHMLWRSHVTHGRCRLVAISRFMSSWVNGGILVAFLKSQLGILYSEFSSEQTVENSEKSAPQSFV